MYFCDHPDREDQQAVILTALFKFLLRGPRFTRLAVFARLTWFAALAAVAGLAAALVLGFGIRGVQVEDLALVDPHLDADDAVGRLGFRKTVVDVGAQRVQRHAAFAIPLRTGDFRAVQAAADIDLDAQR